MQQSYPPILGSCASLSRQSASMGLTYFDSEPHREIDRTPMLPILLHKKRRESNPSPNSYPWQGRDHVFAEPPEPKMQQSLYQS